MTRQEFDPGIQGRTGKVASLRKDSTGLPK